MVAVSDPRRRAAVRFADAFQFRAQALGLGVPHELLIALPYLVAIAALATFVCRAAAPAAIGRYVKE